MPQKIQPESVKWPSSRIREELTRLDQLTGYHGADLPIHYGNSRCTLASFHHNRGQASFFMFSRHYFDAEDFSEHSALDTIRHEYAHYMNVVEGNDDGHGPAWKDCCRRIGALAVRLYEPAANEVHLKKEKKTEKLRETLSASIHEGQRLIHPIWGYGVILRVDSSAASPRLEILFSDGKEHPRLYSAQWVIEHCKLLPQQMTENRHDTQAASTIEGGIE